MSLKEKVIISDAEEVVRKVKAVTSADHQRLIDNVESESTATLLVQIREVTMWSGLWEQALDWRPFSGYTRGQTTQRQQAFPWDPSQSTPGDRLHRDRQAFPWGPSEGKPGDRLHRDRQAFPWDSSQGTPGDRLHRDRQAFPWDPSQDTPGDRQYIQSVYMYN